MATLEVHDGRGQVERLIITRDRTAMIGSSPKCDVVLNGEGILPFHGRIRWQPQKRNFKVDASPEAKFLLVNGHKMSNSSFRQGDEIQIGDCRVFMIRDEDDCGPAPAAPPRDDVTRVQGPTFLAPPAPGTVIQRGSARASRERSKENVPFEFPVGEMDAVLTDVAPAPIAPKKTAHETPARVRERPAKKPSLKPERGWARFFHLFSSRAHAPGQEEVMASPLAIGLVGAFLGLVLVGYVLFGIIRVTAANRLFNTAVQDMEEGDYRTAIQRFDEFSSSNPQDVRAGKARVHRAMANVRQYTSTAGPSWSLALEAERMMLDSVAKEETYRDSSSELAELVLRTGEAIADRARTTADRTSLKEAESAVTLHARVAGAAAKSFLEKSQLPAKLQSARAAVLKAEVRSRALAAMDAALKAGSSHDVYAARDALVAGYGDQAADRELLARMDRANELIKKAVTFDSSQRPSETEPYTEPLGPPTTLVLRNADAARATPEGPLAFALADGSVYAVDGLTGAPLWQSPLGLSSPFPPQPIPGGSTVLAVDARHDELARLDARTGGLVWRQALGEPVSAPPLVLGNQVIQATPTGKVLFLNLSNGRLEKTADLGQRLCGTPVSDESGQALYVTAEKDCLFVLTRDPLACEAVVYLGHAAGSILCPPARLGRYLIVPENHGLNEGRWRVFVIDENGIKLTPVQQLPVSGWTWATPATSGTVVWATGDRGGVSAYAAGAYGEANPFRLIARINPDAQPSGPAYALARLERELWVGSARSGRYELDPEGGKLASTWTLAEAGPALAAPQVAGSTLVLTQQYGEGPGVALWGVDPRTGAVKWRTVVGAAWPSPLLVSKEGGNLKTLGVDGTDLTLTREMLARGGFVTATLPKPGNFRLPATALERVEGDGWTAIVPALRSTRLLARGGAGDFQEVRLPVPVAALPLAWGRNLVVPGQDGRVHLIDPLTGESRAEPFVPPFDRARPTRWRAPVALGPDAAALADDAGRVRRLAVVKDPRPRLVATTEISLDKELVADPAATTRALVVATADGRIRALAARDLSPAGAWPLAAPLALGPVSAGGCVFVADRAGGVLAIGEDGQRLWSIELENKAIPINAPAVTKAIVQFLDRSGVLHTRSLSDGAAIGKFELGLLPTDGPIVLEGDVVVPAGLGTVRLSRE